MIGRHPRSPRTDPLVPYTTRFRSLAGLAAPTDGTTLHWDDPAAVQAAAAAARRLGFGGQLCIHPRQVAPVNQGFLPSEQELAWAQRVVQAVAEGGRGAIRSEEHTSELQSLMRTSYAVFCLTK